MGYLSEIFWRHSWDVCTQVPDKSEFLACLSVCFLAYFLTKLDKYKDISGSKWNIFLKLFGDIPWILMPGRLFLGCTVALHPYACEKNITLFDFCTKNWPKNLIYQPNFSFFHKCYFTTQLYIHVISMSKLPLMDK